MPDEIEGSRLPAIARAAVLEALASGALPAPSLPPATASTPVAATFVTITKDGKLRGCMGTTVARRPLVDEVQSQARAAAFRDPRFPPVEKEELDALSFEVSVLCEPESLPAKSWEEACERVRPGQDGVIVRTAVGGALFLPQVWETFSQPSEFLDQLWKKAGLPHRYFDPDVALSIFSVEKFTEPELD
jgi:AmmeMemoRadiSam system protein A